MFFKTEIFVFVAQNMNLSRGNEVFNQPERVENIFKMSALIENAVSQGEVK